MKFNEKLVNSISNFLGEKTNASKEARENAVRGNRVYETYYTVGTVLFNLVNADAIFETVSFVDDIVLSYNSRVFMYRLPFKGTNHNYETLKTKILNELRRFGIKPTKIEVAGNNLSLYW